jgi:hypothetical protein
MINYYITKSEDIGLKAPQDIGSCLIVSYIQHDGQCHAYKTNIDCFELLLTWILLRDSIIGDFDNDNSGWV